MRILDQLWKEGPLYGSRTALEAAVPACYTTSDLGTELGRWDPGYAGPESLDCVVSPLLFNACNGGLSVVLRS